MVIHGDKLLTRFDLTNDARRTVKLEDLEIDLSDLAPLLDGLHFAIAGGTAIQIRDLETGSLQMALQGHRDTVTRLAVCPDGKILASTSEDGTVKLWDLFTGREVMSIAGHKSPPIAFSPDGRRFATANGSDIFIRP